MTKLSRWISTEYDRVECPHIDKAGVRLPMGMRISTTSSGEAETPFEDKLNSLVHEPLNSYIASVFDAARDRWGSPILVTSGVRCFAYQQILKERGLRTAEVSPHCYGVALDIVPKFDKGELDAPEFVKDQVRLLARYIREVDTEIRIFVALYDFKFIHMDCAFVLHDPLPDGRPKPEAWKAGVRDYP